MNGYLSQLDTGQSQIDQAEAQLDAGQGQLDSGWAQISQAKTALAACAGRRLPEKEQEPIEGWSGYEEGTKQRQKNSSQKEKRRYRMQKMRLKRFEHAKWYVNDRNECDNGLFRIWGQCGQDAAIGEVFPVLFFLVAALVSLTTMTGMVEEQRTLIGTLKALGYERHSIAGKYLGYAFLATVGGCVVGVLVGKRYCRTLLLQLIELCIHIWIVS